MERASRARRSNSSPQTLILDNRSIEDVPFAVRGEYVRRFGPNSTAHFFLSPNQDSPRLRRPPRFVPSSSSSCIESTGRWGPSRAFSESRSEILHRGWSASHWKQRSSGRSQRASDSGSQTCDAREQPHQDTRASKPTVVGLRKERRRVLVRRRPLLEELHANAPTRPRVVSDLGKLDGACSATKRPADHQPQALDPG